jgi:hypothetical protein
MPPLLMLIARGEREEKHPSFHRGEGERFGLHVECRVHCSNKKAQHGGQCTYVF